MNSMYQCTLKNTWNYCYVNLPFGPGLHKRLKNNQSQNEAHGRATKASFQCWIALSSLQYVFSLQQFLPQGIFMCFD